MKERKKQRFTVYGLIIGIVLGIYSALIIAVLLWGFMMSLKTDDEFLLFDNPYPWFDMKIEFKYFKAFTAFTVNPNPEGFHDNSINLGGLFVNSLTYSLGCATVATLSPLVMAYVSAKYKYAFSNFIPKIVITAMVVPIVGTTAATLEILRTMNLYDTYFGALILKAGFTCVYFLVFYSAFQTLSWEYAEAAFVDGASHFRVMFGIMIPLIKPIIFSVFLIFFVQFWNDYQTLYTYYPSGPTAALGLFYFNRNTTTSADETMLLTGCFMVTIPALVLFLVFRDKLMGNISMGGIKG